MGDSDKYFILLPVRTNSVWWKAVTNTLFYFLSVQVLSGGRQWQTLYPTFCPYKSCLVGGSDKYFILLPFRTNPVWWEAVTNTLFYFLSVQVLSGGWQWQIFYPTSCLFKSCLVGGSDKYFILLPVCSSPVWWEAMTNTLSYFLSVQILSGGR